MIELVNLSNTAGDLQYLLDGSLANLDILLKLHKLQGVEIMFAEPWDELFPPQRLIGGVHLRFWPNWLDFWRNDRKMLQRAFSDESHIIREFGCLEKASWLELFHQNIRDAIRCGAPYLVFHVTNMRPWELGTRSFEATDEEVVTAAIELINLFVAEIPDTTALLFENLWWAGFTLHSNKLTERLLSQVNHRNCGIMLDTGHLMITDSHLRTERDSIQFVLDTIDNMGNLADYIKGVHLHKSLSGMYAEKCKAAGITFDSMEKALSYTLDIDQHQPFTDPGVRKILSVIRPEYLVHEFVPSDFADWHKKITVQRQALGLE